MTEEKKIITAEEFDNIKEEDRDFYDFVVEEWISNWERAYEKITKEEFFLMLFKFSKFIWEDWELNEDFFINFSKWDVKNRPSEWAEEAYVFVVSEKFSAWENPKSFILQEEVWNVLFKFLKDYHQFQTIWRIDKYKDETVRVEWLSEWAKRWYDWILKNKISDWKNPIENISRMEIWKILLRVYEILEDEQ